jgi:hypothetical protein
MFVKCISNIGIYNNFKSQQYLSIHKYMPLNMFCH